ncbi:MAG: Hsp70 family protein [Fibrella sp.]|nr:Hsp70 family protein [Armatimonadota bacterium]
MSTPDTNEAIIGIDLGTSTSAIAALIGGRPDLIQDAQGDRIVPSVVQITPDGETLVGSVAKHGAVAFHDRTALEAKRLMGTGETIKIAGQEKTPEEIGALVLGYLKGAAESKLGRGSVRDVVISVPARFENAAREATKRAAELAGLNVLRLINEPTAAALAYGLDRLQNNQKVLVFDFGGGTLDVTVLEMFDGVLDVKTSVGDDKLGGKDIDEAVVKLFRDVYKDQYGKSLPPPSKDRKIAQVLKEEAESAKRRLSSSVTLSIDIPYLGTDGGLSFLLTRQKFEEICEPLLMRSMVLVNEALSRARLQWGDIDVVLPIGGSSRIPLFRRAIEYAWGKELRDYENPDEAVAKGAAIAAGLEKRMYEGESDIVVQDVSPHRLGIATIKQVGAGQFVDDYFSEIIPKDAKLPSMAKRSYRAAFGDGEEVIIRIYEAATDSNLCRDHHLVNELRMKRFDSGDPAEEIQVEFVYTLDGTLNVSARYISAPMLKVEGVFDLNASRSISPPMTMDTGTPPAAGTGASLDTAERDTPASPPSPPVAAGSGLGLLDETPATPNPQPPSTSTLTPAQLNSLWKKRPGADQCAPLLEQAERAAMEHPESAKFIRASADELKMALISGTGADVRQKLDALTDVLFDLA